MCVFSGMDQESCIQQVVDDLARQARDDGFQLNERKCKELRISFAKNEPDFKALELSGLLKLYNTRQDIAAKLFDEICANQSYSLHNLIPSKCQPSYSLREQRRFLRPKCKTERCKNSFLLSYVYSS